MGLTEKVTSFLSQEQDDDEGQPKLALLLASLASDIEALESEWARPRALRRIARLATRASGVALETLPEDLPPLFRRHAGPVQDRVGEVMQRVQQQADARNHEGLLELHGEVVGCMEAVSDLTFEAGEHSEVGTWIKRTVVLLIAAGSGLAGWYLQSDRGLALEQAAMVQPAGSFETVSEIPDGDTFETPIALEYREAWLASWMEQFSRHYFGYDSHWTELYYDQPEPDEEPPYSTFEAQVVLRNDSHGEVMMISNVDATVVAVEEAEFPWRRLKVTPKVTWSPSEGWQLGDGVLNSDGFGPAVDVAWKAEAASGLSVGQGRERLMFHRAVRPLEAPRAQNVMGRERRQEGFGAGDLVALERDEGGRLKAPIYRKLAAAPSPRLPRHVEVTPEQTLVAHDHGWFERVTDPGRLAELTRVAYDAPIPVEVRFRSMLDERHRVTHEQPIPTDIVLMRARPELREYDPAAHFDPGEDPDNDNDGIFDMVDRVDLFELLVDPDELATIEGEQLIVVHLGVDVESVGVGGMVAHAKSPARFLAPQGALVVFVKIARPRSYRYRVELRVAGDPVTTLSFAPLVPGHTTFKGEGMDRAVERMLQVAGGPVQLRWDIEPAEGDGAAP